MLILLLLTVATASEQPFVATAYCLTGKTATGPRAGPGTVAVDPKVIPLGSRVHVSGYGWAVARDTGRAIKGRRVDVWLASRKACRRWGRQTVRVRVVPPSPRRRQRLRAWQ